jgi:type IV pilus assembly protein PilN
MIRINLLQVREVKHRLELRSQIRVACMLLVMAVGLGVWVLYTQGQTRQARERELQQLEAEIKSLEKIIQEVQQFEERRAFLQRELGAIKGLRASQRFPAPYLDEISRRLPDQVWLVALKESGSSVRISGKSLNGNPGVADFMKNIERSPLFGTAGLIESKSETLQDRSVMSFTIAVPIIAPEKEPATS